MYVYSCIFIYMQVYSFLSLRIHTLIALYVYVHAHIHTKTCMHTYIQRCHVHACYSRDSTPTTASPTTITCTTKIPRQTLR